MDGWMDAASADPYPAETRLTRGNGFCSGLSQRLERAWGTAGPPESLLLGSQKQRPVLFLFPATRFAQLISREGPGRGCAGAALTRARTAPV